MENPRKITLVGDRHEALKKFGQGQALLRATKAISDLLGLPYYRLFSSDKEVMAQSIKGVQDQITLSVEEVELPIKEKEEKIIERIGYGILAQFEKETKRVYFRCENKGLNFFLDLSEVETGTINRVFLISGLYDCLDIGVILYRVGTTDCTILKYRVGGFESQIVEYTHPSYYLAGGPIPDTSTYRKRSFTYEKSTVVIYNPQVDQVPPTIPYNNVVTGLFTVTDSLDGTEGNAPDMIPQSCVVWYDGAEGQGFSFSLLKYHIVAYQMQAHRITGHFAGESDKSMDWNYIYWWWNDGSTSWWNWITTGVNATDFEVLVTGHDEAIPPDYRHYQYGTEYGPEPGTHLHKTGGGGVVWQHLRDTSWDYDTSLKYEMLLSELHCWPILNANFKGVRGYLHLHAIHKTDFSTLYANAVVAEGTRTVYSLTNPTITAKKRTYLRSHSLGEANYAPNWTVYMAAYGNSILSFRNPWGGGIAGRVSGADMFVGWKMKDYDNPWAVRPYNWLKGVYVIDDEEGIPQIYGIQEGSSPPIAENIDQKYFPWNPYLFGQTNKIGGGRELLAPRYFNVIKHCPVCLIIPNLVYEENQGPITNPIWIGLNPEAWDYTLNGRKLSSGSPNDIVSWQFYGYAENYGIWPTKKDLRIP